MMPLGIGISWIAIVKGWHFTEFAILTVLAAHAQKWFFGKITFWSIVTAMVFATLYAVSDEWHQAFIPDRFGTVQDVLIDSLGVCAAGAIMVMRLKRINLKTKSREA
jgi:VanZ family protein